MVEHSPHHRKVKGLSPATDSRTEREKKIIQKMLSRAKRSSFSRVIGGEEKKVFNCSTRSDSDYEVNSPRSMSRASSIASEVG